MLSPASARCGAALALCAGLLTACLSRGGLDDDPPGVDGAGPGPGDDGGVSADAAPAGDAGGGGLDASTPSSDPFDPASCEGPALSGTRALGILGAAPRLKLADATLYRRARSCSGMTEDTCGAWGPPAVHQQALLTYSGGVVTDYKTFSFPTHLILFAQGGQPRLSVRHESDYRHDAGANTRGVLFSFGADPMVNSYPVIYVWDFFPAPNRYDDLQGLLGDDGYLYARERCARVVFKTGLSTEIAALYRY